MQNPHPFDAATHLSKTGPGEYSGHTHPRYDNMAGPYGGITAACLLNAVLEDARRIGDPVSMTVNLCAPVADGPFALSAVPRRSGKYIQHWAVELTQNGQLCTTASVICANRSESFHAHPGQMPQVPQPSGVPPLDLGDRMAWLRAYEFRFIEGIPDFKGLTGPGPHPARSVQYVADLPPRPLDYLSLTAIADSFILRIFKVRPAMVPMGTVSITTHFIATAAEIAAQGTTPVLGVVDSTRMTENFHDQTMQIWGKSGNLLASGNQLAWFKT